MELKDFVAATLTQICQGIEQAKEDTAVTGAKISPVIDKDNLVVPEGLSTEKACLVHFDIDIAERKETQTGGGVKVLLEVISGGVSHSHTGKDEKMHHVSFDVPVVWPTSGRNPSIASSHQTARYGDDYDPFSR